MKPSLQYLLAARASESRQLAQLTDMADLVRSLAELVHRLQRERGLANIVLGSQGCRARTAWSAQVQASQEAATHVQAQLDRMALLHSPVADRTRLLNLLALALHELEVLPQLREQVQAGSLHPDQATQALSSLVSILLALIFELADISTDPLVTKHLLALFFLLQGKELAGQERAYGAAGFAQGSFDGDRLGRLAALADAQQRCFELFTASTTALVLEIWQQQAPEVQRDALSQLLLLASKAQPPHILPAELSELWYDQCTLRMDAILKVECAQLQAFVDCCHQQQARLQTDAAGHDALAQLALPQAATSMSWILQPDAEPGAAATLTEPQPALVAETLNQALSPVLLQLLQAQRSRLAAVSEELAAARSALAERKLVERAKGLLMMHRKLSEDQAYRLLRQTAMERHQRLADVARTLINLIET